MLTYGLFAVFIYIHQTQACLCHQFWIDNHNPIKCDRDQVRTKFTTAIELIKKFSGLFWKRGVGKDTVIFFSASVWHCGDWGLFAILTCSFSVKLIISREALQNSLRFPY